MVTLKLYGETLIVPPGGVNADGTDAGGEYIEPNVANLRGPAAAQKPFAIPEDAVFYVRHANGTLGADVTTGVIRCHDGEVLCWKRPAPALPSFVQ